MGAEEYEIAWEPSDAEPVIQEKLGDLTTVDRKPVEYDDDQTPVANNFDYLMDQEQNDHAILEWLRIQSFMHINIFSYLKIN